MDRQPSHDTIQPAGAKESFGLLGGVFLGAVYGIGFFWSITTAKPGTVGLKAYWLDGFIGMFILMALCTCQVEPDRTLFQGSLVLAGVMFWVHLLSTLCGSKHVLMHSVGQRSRWLEAFAFVAVFLLNAAAEAWIFTVFVLASIACQLIRDALIKTRDKIRAANMADAIAQQQYSMNHFDAYRRG